MTGEQLDRIWKNHEDGNPPVAGTSCSTNGDGDRIIATVDETYEQKAGETVWRKMKPLKGNF